MLKAINKNANRLARHRRVRKKIFGTSERPRLTVFKSNKNIYAQIIDDETGKTLVSASSVEKEFDEGLKSKANSEVATKVGQEIGKRAKEAGIEEIVFDRSGYQYHGKIKALAEAVREAGVKF